MRRGAAAISGRLRSAIAAGGCAGLVAAALVTAPASAQAQEAAPPSAQEATPADPQAPGDAPDETPGAPLVVAPSKAHGAWVAKILRPTHALPAPGSKRPGWSVGTTVPGGYFPQELLVLAQRRDDHGQSWLKVRLSRRPNDAAGWIPADAVRLRHTDWWVSISTRRRTVRAYEKGRLRIAVRAVVGAPATPTPHGLFAVMLVARQPNRNGFLGPWALHLTSHSNVLENFGGGPGRVALHGRGGASLRDPLGSARSHGCIRISNGPITRLARVLRPGTPVQISG